MREVKEPTGPSHDVSGSVVVPSFYAQQKQHPLGPPHSLAHQQPPPPSHPQPRPVQHPQAVPAHQQQPQPTAMRGSPAPPPAGSNPQPPHPPHSPHMPPSVGGPGNVVLPNHPNPAQSEARNSSMHAPGYPPNAPPHMPTGPPGPHGYPTAKMHMPPGPPGAPYGQPTYQHGPGGHQYNPSRPQGHMMQAYPQGYPPGGPQGPQGPPSSMPPGHQYTPRPPPPPNSHVPQSQPYGYPPHYAQQPWPQNMSQGPPGSAMAGGSMMAGGPPNMPPGKGANQIPGQPSQPGSNSVGGPRPHTPPHYHKPHIHKYVTPAGAQMYPNGPGMSPAMMNSREGTQNNMPPPTSTPQPLPPISSSVDMDHPSPGAPITTGSNSMNNSSSNSTSNSSSISSASSNTNSIMNNSNPPQIGPDGIPVVDDASQQSTVSNASAASGDDISCTPNKPLHKEGIMSGVVPMSGMGSSGGGIIGSLGGPHPPSHPSTPLNSAHSPGTASMTSQQDEFENTNSPGWPRSPSGPPPVFANTQPPPPQEIYRATKAGDSLMRLYEMSDSPERKAWLDKLLRYMEDNKTPITTCPTISKNPLDLYALYLHVRERGGFEEVTKNKHWKDVAAVMGIGASSSGSYTLRKHYMKHLLYYECKFDRGGIDPQPIINQIESSQKKKTTKTLSVPSPGSNSSSMEGFPNGPHMPGGPGMPNPYSQYPPSTEYPGHMQQRPNQPNAPGYQGYGGNQYNFQGMHGGYPQGGYPNSGFPPERVPYPAAGPPNHHGSYPTYQGAGYPRASYPPPHPPQQGYPQDHYPPMGNSGPPPPNSFGNSQLAKQLLNPTRNPTPIQGYPGNTMYPPQKPGSAPSPGPQPPSTAATFQGPKRHPDFEKTQPGWRPPNSHSQFGYGGAQPQGPPQIQQPWPRPPESGPPPGPPQWSQPRYPPPTPPNFPNQVRWPGASATGPRTQSPVVGSKSYVVPPNSFKWGGNGPYMGKQLFPMDSVEAVSPVLFKRKRMGRSDLQQVDPWRLLMSLRCGLASEVTWALDVLNILLFDDQTVIYFCLHHMPGLLESLIEHLRRGLINMFNICSELELGTDDEATGANKRIKAEQHNSDHPWYLRPPPSPSLDLDLGKVNDDHDPNDKEVYLRGPDYTSSTRTGKPVRIVKKEAKLFMKEGSREWDKWEGFDSGVDTWSVGGGECTAHIICSMQSSIPSLPFTRLLVGPPPAKVPKGELKSGSSCDISIKIEKVEPLAEKEDTKCDIKREVELRKEKSALVVPTKEIKPPPVKPEAIKPSQKMNGPKEGVASKAMGGSKFGRKNNARTFKLDEIVKRIKKEPIDSSCDNIFGKPDKNIGETDSKSILDHYLKKNQTNNDGENNEASDNRCKSTANQNPTNLTVQTSEPQEEIKESLTPPDVKSSTKSPLKLLSISPIKITDKPNDQGSGSPRRDSIGFKRPYDHLEEESWGPDEASLSTTTEGQDWLARRVIGVGTVIRNLSFIPGNEELMSKSASLLALLGKTILLHHEHPNRSPSTSHYDRDEETDFSDWCSSLAPDTFWWWPYLHHVHENTLVTLANIAGHLDLSYYPEEISRPILNGLLHWATCPASYGQDPLPGSGVSSQSALSPQRLALEALVKLCVLDPNTDLVLATPPFSRLDMLCSHLTRLLCRGEDQVLREFALNLFHYFSAADSGVARVIAMQNGCVSLLVAFIEEAESAALNIANIQGVTALKENPELMGTSLDMVRRSANTLVNLSRVPDNARVITTCENRLLTLVMSQILDTYVASQLSQVLFNVAQVLNESCPPSPPALPFSALVAERSVALQGGPGLLGDLDAQPMEAAAICPVVPTTKEPTEESATATNPPAEDAKEEPASAPEDVPAADPPGKEDSAPAEGKKSPSSPTPSSGDAAPTAADPPSSSAAVETTLTTTTTTTNTTPAAATTPTTNTTASPSPPSSTAGSSAPPNPSTLSSTSSTSSSPLSITSHPSPTPAAPPPPVQLPPYAAGESASGSAPSGAGATSVNCESTSSSAAVGAKAAPHPTPAS